MPGSAHDYYDQLNRASDKSLVLQRFIAATMDMTVPISVVRKLVRLYGANHVFVAILSIAHKSFENSRDLISYLFGTCKNIKTSHDKNIIS